MDCSIITLEKTFPEDTTINCYLVLPADGRQLAVLVMMRFVPLGPFSEVNQQIVAWILSVPNMAAKRAIMMGIGLGGAATAIKIILGIERTYMGRE